MPNGTQSAWTDELVQKLKQLHADKYSAQQISDALFAQDGVFFTRNAIVGKAYRLRLLREKPAPSPKVPRIRKPRVRAEKPATPKPAKKSLPPQPFTFTPRVVALAPRHITFAEINGGTCKYECSEQDDAAAFTFCGHPPAPDKPYCAAHCGLTYIAPQPFKPSYVRRFAA